MPKLKKGEQLLTMAAGINVYTSENEVPTDKLPEGIEYAGRIASDSNVRIGATPLNEIRRAFASWTQTVKGVEKSVIEKVRMHIAFQLDEEELETVLRNWHGADAETRVQQMNDMASALSDDN